MDVYPLFNFEASLFIFPPIRFLIFIIHHRLLFFSLPFIIAFQQALGYNVGKRWCLEPIETYPRGSTQ